MKRETGHVHVGLRRRVGANIAGRSTRRRILFAAAAWPVIAQPFASFAQQPAKVARIGFLGSTSLAGYSTQLEAFRAGLRDFGYVEGSNILIEYRWAESNYERLPELAAELVRLKVDVIVTHGTPGSLAVKQATTSIPIVMAAIGDAVAVGVVASLARPGGNITGTTFLNPELAAKRLEIIRDAMPSARRVAVLFNSANPSKEPILNAMELTAKFLKLELQQFAVRAPAEFDGAFLAMAAKRVDACATFEDPMIIANAKVIADLAVTRRLPSIGFPDFAGAGGLIVNRKTAMMLNIKLPDLVLQRADKVIE